MVTDDLDPDDAGAFVQLVDLGAFADAIGDLDQDDRRAVVLVWQRMRAIMGDVDPWLPHFCAARIGEIRGSRLVDASLALTLSRPLLRGLAAFCVDEAAGDASPAVTRYFAEISVLFSGRLHGYH